LKVCISGTGFAGDYTAQVYGMIRHRDGLVLDRAGVCSGHYENARKFADAYGFREAYRRHGDMVREVQPDIANIACANRVHGQYVMEAAEAGVRVISLEKPPVIWPGYAEDRTASAEVRKMESMDFLRQVLNTVRRTGAKLLYAEDFVYFDGIVGIVEVMREAVKHGKGKVLYQTGVCAHQGSHAPAYDTPAVSGGGALFNKACHPLGPILYLKQIEGILTGSGPIRPARVSAVALQVLKHQASTSGQHFRVMQNVDDFGRITVLFTDKTVAEVYGHDLSISGIRNEVSVITDFAQYDVRVNPNNANQLFLPDERAAGNLLFREKLPTAQGTSFPMPNQHHAHGFVNEANDAIDCALDEGRYPQSGSLMAWDTMAVLMAAYESAEKDSMFVDVTELVDSFAYVPAEGPDPAVVGSVFQRT
jgi:predicted dehydrogenase